MSLYVDTVTGLHQYNQRPVSPKIGYWAYLGTGSFLDGLFKNLEAAVLQLGVLIVLGAVLHQRGASHSRKPGETGERHQRRGRGHSEPSPGWKRWLYEHSFSLAFFALFLIFLILHIIYGTADHNETARLMHQPALSVVEYFRSPDCWFQVFQTWQAEFFAIGIFVVFSIFLREKGSAESKPEDASNRDTGTGE